MIYIKLNCLFCLVILSILILNIDNKFLDLIKMYKSTNTSVNVILGSGLGNRLMSFAGIIILSIYFKSKPFCILVVIYK